MKKEQEQADQIIDGEYVKVNRIDQEQEENDLASQASYESSENETDLNFLEFTGLSKLQSMLNDAYDKAQSAAANASEIYSNVTQTALTDTNEFMDTMASVGKEVRDFFVEQAELDVENEVEHLVTGAVLESAAEHLGKQPDTPQNEIAEELLDMAALQQLEQARKDSAKVNRDVEIAAGAEALREIAERLRKDLQLDKDQTSNTHKVSMTNLLDIAKSKTPPLQQQASDTKIVPAGGVDPNASKKDRNTSRKSNRRDKKFDS